MTQRSIFAGTTPTVIVKVLGSVTVNGREGDQVSVETEGGWGLKVEKRNEAEIGRARAVVGEHVLFDVRIKRPEFSAKKTQQEVIEVKAGGSGKLWVPFGSDLKVYAGKDIAVLDIQGIVDAYAGHGLTLKGVLHLGNASAGWKMDLDCQSITGKDMIYTAGSDLRFHVAELTSARLRVKDLGGYWEARIGNGEKSVYLKSGGDVTLVTDQKVEPLPPDYILGKIEKPSPG